MAIQVRRLAYGLGAEVRGFSAKALSPEVVAEVRAAWLEHQVLVFPDMDMTVDEHIGLSRQFGELEIHPDPSVRNGSRPEVLRVTNAVENGKRSVSHNAGRRWHSDGAFTTRPPTASLLHCRALPDVGGDTWFTSMYVAYDTLSDTLRGIVDRLEVVNTLAKAPSVRTRTPEQIAAALSKNPPVIQRLVRVHPETGRKALYVNEMVTQKIHGMTEEESAGLIGYLLSHCTRPEFTYRHTWRLHDLVMWDNRCTMHLAPPDYDPSQLRDMWRTTLTGEPCGRLAEA